MNNRCPPLLGLEYDAVFETIEGYGVFEALNNCIMLGSEPLEAANHLDRIPVVRQRIPLSAHARSLRRFWRAFLEIARQVPYYHDGQRKLAEIIWYLNFLPPPSEESGISSWASLPEFERMVRESWHRPVNPGNNGKAYDRWVNLNTFAARVYNQNIVELYDLGVYSVRGAFERDNYPSPEADKCYVDAAAQWMIYSAPKLFLLTQTSNRGRATFPSRGYVVLEGPAFHGTTVITLARWIYWKVCFNQKTADGWDQPFTAYTYMSIADGDAGMLQNMELLRAW